MSCRYSILRLLLLVLVPWFGAWAQELVSIGTDGLAGTADSGYLGRPVWMDGPDSLLGCVYWSRPAVLSDGSVLFVSWLPVAGQASAQRAFTAAPGDAPSVLVPGTTTDGVWEVIAAGGFRVFVRGGEGNQSLCFRTAGSAVERVIPTPGLVEMRQLRAASDGPLNRVVFTGEYLGGLTGIFSLSLLDGVGMFDAPTLILGSAAGESFPDVANDGAGLVYLRADDHIIWQTPAGSTDLGKGTEPCISADGSTVGFVAADVLQIRDRATGRTESVGDFAPGVAASPAVSDNGRFVIFRSTAPLVFGLGQTELANGQIYLYDRESTGLRCLTGNGSAKGFCPASDGSGRYLAFAALDTSLGPSGFYQVYRFDRGTAWTANHAPVLTGTTTLYCAAAGPTELSLAASDPEGDAVEIALLSGPTEAQGTVADKYGATVEGWVAASRLPLQFSPAANFSGRLSLQFQARDRAGDSASLVTLPLTVSLQVGTSLECLTATLDVGAHTPHSDFARDRIGVSGDGDWLLYGAELPDSFVGYAVWLHRTTDGTRWAVERWNDGVTWPEAVLARVAHAGVYCGPDSLHWFAFTASGIGATAASAGAEATSPSLSDDGATVVFERDGSVHVWRPAEGTDAVALVAGTAPTVSGDGRVLAYVAGDTIQVLRGADGVFAATPVATVADADGSITNLRLSAGGRYLLYEAGVGPTLKVVNLTAVGDGPLVAIEHATCGELAASGSSLYYLDNTTNVAHWRSLLTAEDRELCSDAGRAVISPDGRFVTVVSTAEIAGGRPSTQDIYRAPIPFDPNHAPTAASATEAVVEDPETPLTFALGFADADAWDRDLLVTVQVAPLHGTVELRHGSGGITVVYTPGANFAGTDSLAYQVTDGTGQSATGTIAIEVAAVDDAPILAEIPDQRLSGPPTFAGIDLADYLTEVDGDELEIVVSGQAELVVTVGADRVIVIFAPTEHWTGTETITVTVRDKTTAALRAERSFVLSNWYHATVTFAAGWNAVAFPVLPSPGSTAAILAFTNRDVRRWNGSQHESVPAAGLQFVPGEGYWMYVPADRAGTLDVLGDFPSTDQAVLRADGWSLVGPVGVGSVCPLPDTLSASDVFRFSPGLLEMVPLGEGEALQSGQAYWIRHDGAEATVPLPLQAGR